jgi:L-asparaginase
LRHKTVVLFGAMIPYSIGGSDALFNFGAAMIAVQTLPPGVYIAMNGQAFPWDNVQKLKDLGRFAYL